MTKFGLKPSFAKDVSILQGEEDMKAFKEVVFDVASQAFGHLDNAR
jgi:hypothetical protein